MDDKRLYVVERNRDREAIFVRASNMQVAYEIGKRHFNESFRVRYATDYEQALAPRERIVEAE